MDPDGGRFDRYAVQQEGNAPQQDRPDLPVPLRGQNPDLAPDAVGVDNPSRENVLLPHGPLLSLSRYRLCRLPVWTVPPFIAQVKILVFSPAALAERREKWYTIPRLNKSFTRGPLSKASAPVLSFTGRQMYFAIKDSRVPRGEKENFSHIKDRGYVPCVFKR